MASPKTNRQQQEELKSRAWDILRSSTPPPPAELLSLAQELKAEKAFGLARRLLATARKDPTLSKDPILQCTLIQQHALCTYKDLDLPPDAKLDRAFEILEETGEDLTSTKNQETLGIAGGICKRRSPHELILSITSFGKERFGLFSILEKSSSPVF